MEDDTGLGSGWIIFKFFFLPCELSVLIKKEQTWLVPGSAHRRKIVLIGVTKLFSRAECWQRGQAPPFEYTGRSVWLGALVWGSLRDWPLITHNYPDPGGTVPLPSHRWTFFSSGRGLAHARGTESLRHRNRGSSLLSLSLRGVLFSDPNALLGTHAVETKV